MSHKSLWYKSGKFPYWGWGILTLVLFMATTTAYLGQKSRYTPQAMTIKVQKDFQSRELRVQNLIKSGDVENPGRWKKSINSASEFALFIEENQKIIFWNTDQVFALDSNKLSQIQSDSGILMRTGSGIYFAQRFPVKNHPNYSAITLIPIAYQYEHPLKYSQPHFVADTIIPGSVQIGQEGIQIVKNKNGKVVFHLSFFEDPATAFKVSSFVILLAALFLTILFLWVNRICINIAKRKNPWIGFVYLLSFILLITLLRLYPGYPAGFINTDLFSPEILATNTFIASLPDLILQILLEVWLIYFFARYVSIRHLQFFKTRTPRLALRLLITFLLLLDIFGEQTSRINTIIINSKIPFVVNNLENLTIFSFIGFGLLALVTLSILFLFHFIDQLLKDFLKILPRNLVIFTLGLIAALLVDHGQAGMLKFDICVLIYTLFLIWYLELSNLRLNFLSRKIFFFNSNISYFLFFFLCFWITAEVFYFNFEKERDFRKVYAFKHNPNNILPFQFPFDQLAQELGTDSSVRSVLEQGDSVARMKWRRDFQAILSRSGFQNLKAITFLLRPNGAFLTPKDSVKFEEIGLSLNLLKLPGNLQPVINPNNQGFWGRIKVEDSGTRKISGYIGVYFYEDQNQATEDGNRLTNSVESSSDQQFTRDYSYSIYKQKRLLFETGDHHFPETEKTFKQELKTAYFKERWLFSELILPLENQEVIVVRYSRNIGFTFVSLFSYSLFIWLILALFMTLLFYGSYANNTPGGRFRFGLTIRAKIALAILSVIFLSLIFIGAITFTFQKKSFEELKNREIQTQLAYFGQTIGQLWSNSKTQPNAPELNRFLSKVADMQGLDLNLYSSKGLLIGTSISSKYKNQLAGDFMDPTALNNFQNGHRKVWVTTRKMGKLTYQGFFMPVKNNNNRVVAYFYLPNYISGESVKADLSGLLTTLFNIYMLVFFIGGLVAVMISNGILRSFYALIEKFRKIRLRHNVLIQWPYRDELGLLAAEYNSMILKVEKMAAQLATNEREEAWRELALQVAHEIKNPLTPMKLNLQYLQKAIAEGRTDIPDLVQKMTGRLVEQIENLNQIATEFANFARMPISKPDKIDPVALLNHLSELYKEQAEFSLHNQMTQPPHILMDKNYFIRIFTNLFKNAIQAVPENKRGKIIIELAPLAENKVKISVTDNGIGISQEVAQNIFLPHFTTKNSGSGLGLAMTKKMVELSGGTINFETEIGSGTCFYVILPVMKEIPD